nr:MAG TPA: DNA REPAIR PROTEIN RAD52 HOMOLOG-BINDING PROTEIN, DNA REPAIR, DNA.7A [Caudoviricetes sp.]
MKAKTIEDVFNALKEPFPPEDIQWRIGQKSKDGKKAMVLPYVTNRAIMDRLDTVVGPENWFNKYRETSGNSDKGYVCELTIIIQTDDGPRCLTREDGASCTNIEPIKGGLSDSMKRAAVQFGIGRYLYNLKESWVALGDYNRFEPPHLPIWALPKGYAEAQVQNNGVELYDSRETSTSTSATTFTQGKYANKAISEVSDIHYLRWVVEQSKFSEDTKKACQERLGELNG